MAAITSLKIQNFRIFDQEGSTFDLAPLTFLTGCNSSGKSSMVKGLLLLSSFMDKLRKQGKNFDITKESLGLRSLQLGDFQTVLNHTDNNDGCIHFSYTYRPVDDVFESHLLLGDKVLEVEYVFSADKNDVEHDAWFKSLRVTLEEKIILEFDTYGEQESNVICPKIIFNPEYLYENYIYSINHGLYDPLELDYDKDYPFALKHVQSGIIHYCPILTLIGEVDKAQVREILSEQLLTDSDLERIVKDFEQSTFQTFNQYYKHLELLPGAQTEICKAIHWFSNLKNLSRISTSHIPTMSLIKESVWSEYIDRKEEPSVNNRKKNTIDLNFVAYKLMQASYNCKTLSFYTKYANGEYVDSNIIDNPIYNFFVTYVLNIIRQAILPSNLFKQICYIPSISSLVKRLYTLEDSTDKFSEILLRYIHSTRNASDYLRKKRETFLNKWLQTFCIAHHIKIENENSLGITLRLYANAEDTVGCRLADVGFGITQLVSILLSIVTNIKYSVPNLNKEDYYGPEPQPPYTIIAIEEPENHLHPAYQSLLADMFYEAWEKYGIMFIVETHSEYLIRKTQVLTSKKQYTNQESLYKNSPFKVYYIPKNDKPYEMIYRKDGNFENDFGTGFYDEATNLAFQTM